MNSGNPRRGQETQGWPKSANMCLRLTTPQVRYAVSKLVAEKLIIRKGNGSDPAGKYMLANNE